MGDEQRAWVLRAGCRCISAVSVLPYTSLEQAWSKLVGSTSDQRRAVATGVTLSIQVYDAKLLAEIEDTITCDHQPESLREKLNRVRVFVREMGTWCSPYGVALTYSNRLQDVIDAPTSRGEARATCPLCPEAGEMTDVALVGHLASAHEDLNAARAVKPAPRHDLTSARLATIMRETRTDAETDDRARDWMEEAAKAILDEVSAYLDGAIGELETEQTDLMRRRDAAGMPGNAHTHAIRSRAHQRDRTLVRALLATGDSRG